MRIKAYTQLLESYRSLSLSHMANSFGVSVEFMDKELSKFIASGRLHCRIDKVGGVVETNRPDSKNFLYQVCACTMSYLSLYKVMVVNGVCLL
jgi:26S proteasome regulatory subunit N7